MDGLLVLFGGVMFVAGGTGLWLYGKEQVPKREAAARPMLMVGPAAAALRWSF